MSALYYFCLTVISRTRQHEIEALFYSESIDQLLTTFRIPVPSMIEQNSRQLGFFLFLIYPNVKLWYYGILRHDDVRNETTRKLCYSLIQPLTASKSQCDHEIRYWLAWRSLFYSIFIKKHADLYVKKKLIVFMAFNRKNQTFFILVT